MFDIVRATSIADPGFLQLLTQVYLESGNKVPDKAALDRLENAIRFDKVRYYMALEQNRVVGVISLSLGFSTMDMRPIGYAGDLYVHPGHRGRGCAHALILAAMDGAHEAGAPRIFAASAQGMEGVYARLGWITGESLTVAIDLESAPPSLITTGRIVFD